MGNILLSDEFMRPLWAAGLIGHPGMADVKSIIATHVPVDESSSFMMSERIRSIQNAKHFYKDFMGKAFETLPVPVFQTLMLRHLATDDQIASSLPEETRNLARQVTKIVTDPIAFHDADTSPFARLAYLSMSLATLETLHRSLQRGSISPEAMFSHKMYQTLIEPIKSLKLSGTEIADNIFKSIREIDFIINYHDIDQCEFIDLGRRYPDEIGSVKFMIKFMGLQPESTLAETLTKTFNVFSKTYNDPHDNFYAVWKSVIAPFQSLLDALPDGEFLRPDLARYALSYAGLRLIEDDEEQQESVYGKKIARIFQMIDMGTIRDAGLTEEAIDQLATVEASKHLADLYYHALTLNPDAQKPMLAKLDDVEFLSMQLIGSEFQKLPWQKMMAHSDDIRQLGSDIYNFLRSNYVEFNHLEPYPPQSHYSPAPPAPHLRLVKG